MTNDNIIKIELLDNDDSEYNEVYYFDKSVMTDERIKQLTEIEELWGDYTSGGYNFDFDVSYIDEEASTYNALYSFLNELECIDFECITVEGQLMNLYDNALSWVFEHCPSYEDYIKALAYIGLSASDIKQELINNCGLTVEEFNQYIGG